MMLVWQTNSPFEGEGGTDFSACIVYTRSIFRECLPIILQLALFSPITVLIIPPPKGRRISSSRFCLCSGSVAILFSFYAPRRTRNPSQRRKDAITARGASYLDKVAWLDLLPKDLVEIGSLTCDLLLFRSGTCRKSLPADAVHPFLAVSRSVTLRARVFDRVHTLCSPLLVLALNKALWCRITNYVLRIDLVYSLWCTILLHLMLAPSSKMHQVKLRLWPLLGLIALCLCLGPSSIVQSVVSQPLDEPSIEPSPTQASPPVFTDFGRQPVFTPVSPGAACKGSVGSDFTCVDGVWYSNKSLVVVGEWHLESPVFVNGSILINFLSINMDWRSTPYEDRPCVNRALITASECLEGYFLGRFQMHEQDYKYIDVTNLALFESATGCPTLPSSSYQLLDAVFNGGYGKRCRETIVDTSTVSPAKCFDEYFPSSSPSTVN